MARSLPMEHVDQRVISVVVPVYSCAEFLIELAHRCIETIESRGDRAEVVLVDDRSPDGAWGLIRTLADADSRIIGIRLSRNFGQHAAISAGLASCSGGKAIVMDGDLQDPPESISDLLDAAAGHDVVFARRLGPHQGPVRRLLGRWYFAVLSVMGGGRIDPSIGGFVLMDRAVVDAFLRFSEKDRHLLFILRWLGFDQTTIEYRRPSRPSGRSSYDLRRRIHHAFRGILFQDTRFLGAIVVLGFTASALGGCLGIWAIVQRLTAGSQAGWTSLVALVLVTFGILVAIQGVVGLYVGRVFEESKGRPIYVVDETTTDLRT